MAFRTFKQYIQDAGNCDDRNSYVQECITYPRSKEKAYDYDGSILKLLELRIFGNMWIAMPIFHRNPQSGVT